MKNRAQKPHVQSWEHDGKGVVWNRGRLADLVHQPAPGHAQTQAEVLQRGDLIASAPDMARALLSVRDWLARAQRDVPDDVQRQVLDSLEKAGLPP